MEKLKTHLVENIIIANSRGWNNLIKGLKHLSQSFEPFEKDKEVRGEDFSRVELTFFLR